jgi:hypothetical protein
MTIDDKIALIDLDDTVADYSGALRTQMRALESPGEKHIDDRPDPEPPYWEARRKLIQGQPGFWRNLLPIARGFDIVDELRASGFDLHVLTKGPRRTVSAWSEKVEWVNLHLPDASPHITSDKSLVYGRILVDDWPPYFTDWLKVRPRGLVICVAQPWNVEYGVGGSKERPNVIRYRGPNIVTVRKAIVEAANRLSGKDLARRQP